MQRATLDRELAAVRDCLMNTLLSSNHIDSGAGSPLIFLKPAQPQVRLPHLSVFERRVFPQSEQAFHRPTL
jgi:hypothetical protein